MVISSGGSDSLGPDVGCEATIDIDGRDDMQLSEATTESASEELGCDQATSRQMWPLKIQWPGTLRQELRLPFGKLVPYGSWRRGEIQSLPRPFLSSAPSLNIVMRAMPGWTNGNRSASPCRDGQPLLAHRYGTPRCFPCSQITSSTLTRRNKGELPTMLRFDVLHQAALHVEDLRERTVASPQVVEWLMGVPQGWTSARPLARQVLESHALFAKSAGGVSAPAPRRAQGATALGAAVLAGMPAQRRHKTLSLFSGCGTLDFALLAWCEPVAYCESHAPAVAVLHARMADGVLPDAQVHADVRTLHASDLRGSVSGIVMGFPCPDISVAGRRRGFAGEQSVLVFEALRLASETQCSFIFMENVDGIRGMHEVWQPLLAALGRQGFDTQWCSLGAFHAGSPQRRLRWFALARRGAHAGVATLQRPLDLRSFSHPDTSGVRFNNGRPPPDQWLLPRSQYPAVKDRLCMLGNAVVPLQAYLAAIILQM